MTTGRTRWVVLLPASKAVTDREGTPPWGEKAEGPQREVLDALGDTDQSDDERPVSQRGTTRAWQRYDGVVHRSADPASLPRSDRRRWHRHVRYVSALAGLVAPTDRLPAYRLEMATVVDELGGGLGPFWRPHVTAELDEVLTPDGVVWLLTGGEYGRAVDTPEGRELLEPRFVRADGETAMPSATVKQARGQLARALVTHPDIARDPHHDDWWWVSLEAAGAPVRLHRVEDDGTQVWRRDDD